MAPRRPRDIGTAAETAVVRYLRSAGFPHAERRALRGAQDAGDITGTPCLAWSVKAGAYAHDPSDRQISDWLAELEAQRVNARADWGALVTRRRGTSNPGRWWAWMPLLSVILLGGGPTAPQPGMRRLLGEQPVRMHLGTTVALLRNAGYGGEVPDA